MVNFARKPNVMWLAEIAHRGWCTWLVLGLLLTGCALPTDPTLLTESLDAEGGSVPHYEAGQGALILDDDVFHQYYFLVQRARGGSATIPVVIPRRNTQETMRIQTGANEQVRVGTSSVEARHYTIREPTGATRQVWADAQGRILKVQLDGGNITATRDELPR